MFCRLELFTKRITQRMETIRVLMLLGLLLMTANSSHSATLTWTKFAGGNGSGSWTNQANWTVGTLPTGTNDTADFTTLDLTADSTITLDGNQSINRINFGDANSGTGAGWLIRPGSPGTSSLTLGGSTPTIAVSGLAGGEVALLGAVVAGTNGLRKSGTSFLQLTNANLYTGGTVLSGSDCRISIAHDRALGTGLVTVGATIGAGQVWFQAGGNRTLTNDFEIRTVRWIIDGTSAASVAAGDLVINGNVLLNMGASNVRDIYCNRNLTLNGNVSVTPASNPFNKQGGFALTLNGTNTFNGPTTISSGTLVVNGRLGSPGTVTVNSGATLTGTGGIAGTVSVLAGGTLSPGVDGAGLMTVGGLTAAATATFNFKLGSTNSAANGVIQINGNANLAGQLNITDAGGFTSGQYPLLRYTGVLTTNAIVISLPFGYSGRLFTIAGELRLDAFRAQAIAPLPDEYLTQTNTLTLDWAAVSDAVGYRVYLGTNGAAVGGATTNSAGIYLGQFTTDALNISNQVNNATPYWRVDYVLADGSVRNGPVWSFTLVNDQDLQLDTWVATDALNRSLPLADTAGLPRTNRPIGIFYFFWHGEHALGVGPRDNTVAIAALNSGTGYTDPHNPWADNPPWQTNANNGVSWYWGQPEAGYYANSDEWVIRRHIALLQAAGVEILGFDSTNGHPETQYPYFTKIAEVIRKMRREGFRVNLKFMFYTHAGSGGSPATVTWLYENFYKPGLYPELWFRWQGKPLIIGYPNGLSAGDEPVSSEVLNFFTWRTGWANGSNPANEWQWIDTPTPQNPGYNTARTDIPEQMPVACGGWANGNLGRSHSNRSQPDYDKFHLSTARTEGLGIFYPEQMFYGLKYDPQFLFVTGWNEWWAGAWDAPTYCYTHLLSECVPANKRYFVDNYNQQYSRDIEPMKGGHGDNYYFQMVAQNRLRRGVRPVPVASAPKSINVSGDFSDWLDAGPVFYDIPGDTVARNGLSSFSNLPNYVNNTGRNDFKFLKVARDASYLYFYAECATNITSYTGSNWMTLFLTGWEGYDFAVNLGDRTASAMSLSRNTTVTNGWTWTTVRSDILYQVASNRLMLRVPRTSLGLTNDPVNFDFHWADNFQVAGDISDFGVNGDSAPDRRFNYRYLTQSGSPVTLLQDDFEAGKKSVWAETWTNGSKWSLTTATSYSSSNCAVCSTANGTNSSMIARLNTSGLKSLRLSFRYKLHNVADAQNVLVQYWTATGWVTVREISRDEYFPTGQAWSYDERQDVWLQFNDARLNSGTNAVFFHPNFAFRIEASGVNTAGQSVWVDDVLASGIAIPTNHAPVLATISNQTLLAGQTLVFTNSASDVDEPPQGLTYSLVNPPVGASVNANSGVFSWRPSVAQSPTVTSVRVRVADDGVPSLSATQSFWVTVNRPVAPSLSAPVFGAGWFQMMIAGDTGPDYKVQSTTNLSAPNWTTLFTTNSPVLPFLFSDGSSTNWPQQFYRVLLGP